MSKKSLILFLLILAIFIASDFHMDTEATDTEDKTARHNLTLADLDEDTPGVKWVMDIPTERTADTMTLLEKDLPEDPSQRYAVRYFVGQSKDGVPDTQGIYSYVQDRGEKS